jgi:hypothetical protein
MLRRTAMPGIAVAVGLLLGTTLILTARHQTASNATPEARSVLPLIGSDAPLGPNGQSVGLSRALVMSPVPVYRPQAALASDDTVSGVWVRSVGVPEVFIRYASGIEVSVRPADFTDRFENFFKRGLADGEVSGTLTTIQEVPVFLYLGGREGSVPGADLLLNGMLVEVVARSVTQDDVVELVNSIISQTLRGQEARLASVP